MTYDELLEQSDVVTFHVVLTKETRHMFGAREIGLMKPTSIVINTSRGPVIDEPELIKALQAEILPGQLTDRLLLLPATTLAAGKEEKTGTGRGDQEHSTVRE